MVGRKQSIHGVKKIITYKDRIIKIIINNIWIMKIKSILIVLNLCCKISEAMLVYSMNQCGVGKMRVWGVRMTSGRWEELGGLGVH